MRRPAYMSFMQGDPEAAFTGHLAGSRRSRPKARSRAASWTRTNTASIPAWVMEQRQLRERQADAADGMTATAPDRPSLRQRLFPNR